MGQKRFGIGRLFDGTFLMFVFLWLSNIIVTIYRYILSWCLFVYLWFFNTIFVCKLFTISVTIIHKNKNAQCKFHWFKVCLYLSILYKLSACIPSMQAIYANCKCQKIWWAISISFIQQKYLFEPANWI